MAEPLNDDTWRTHNPEAADVVSLIREAGITPESLTAHSTVIAEVCAERERQVGLGYDAAHDDEHGYAILADRAFDLLADVSEFVTAKDTRVGLVQVAAVVVAAIEAFDRTVNPDERQEHEDDLDLKAIAQEVGEHVALEYGYDEEADRG